MLTRSLVVILAFAVVVIPAGIAPAVSSPASRGTPAADKKTHWAFVAPRAAPAPAVSNKRWPRNFIDSFVLARLEQESIAPSPEADRRTLIRRLGFDLTGLPPSPEQVRAFLDDPRPDAYERLVDSMLASPHFGERWGRHWLDLARYADTSGYQIDRPRPFAYLYRDWVIDAINDDVPFDRFTIEQLAGDLLPGATVEQKTAAGFHRLTLSNHEDGVDAEEFRCKAKVDRVSTTGTVWLGLTLACAECHNHKYDPISQREFYQLYAFFNNADEVDVPAPRANDPTRLEKEKKDWEAEQARLKAWLASLTRARDIQADQVKRQLARHRRAQPKPTDAAAMSFQERTNSPRAHVHVRGDFLRKGEEVVPNTPAALNPIEPRCARPDRLDLARWMARPENPLTARVAVNHVWLHLFGRGLVATTEDFGTRGEPPSHPALLDALAVAFQSTANGPRFTIHDSPPAAMAWSRKALIRLIVTSATYRQSSHARPELAQIDPQNRLLARQNRLRLESETIRDSYLDVSGLLNSEVGGPSFRPHMPEDVKRLGTAGAFSWTDTDGSEKYRRGLYIFAQRTVPYPTSMTFDQADPTQSCTRRERSNTPLQALTLLNHGIFVECAQALANRFAELPAASVRGRLAAGFEWCLARKPTVTELDRLEQLYAQQFAACSAQRLESVTSSRSRSSSEGAGAVGRSNPSTADTSITALTAVAQVLLNLDEFVTRE